MNPRDFGKVAVLMGSASDREKMAPAAETLERLATRLADGSQ